MKFAVVSDLHVEAHEGFPKLRLTPEEAVLLIASDIREGSEAMDWAQAQLNPFGAC